MAVAENELSNRGHKSHRSIIPHYTRYDWKCLECQKNCWDLRCVSRACNTYNHTSFTHSHYVTYDILVRAYDYTIHQWSQELLVDPKLFQNRSLKWCNVWPAYVDLAGIHLERLLASNTRVIFFVETWISYLCIEMILLCLKCRAENYKWHPTPVSKPWS